MPNLGYPVFLHKIIAIFTSGKTAIESKGFGIFIEAGNNSVSVKYSIIIPAFNEEVFLPKTLAKICEAMEKIKMPGEIIVVNNNSTDGTAAIPERYGAKVVFEPINQISRARNTGAKAANGSYLIFLDADTNIPPILLQSALETLDCGHYCGGGVTVAMDGTLSQVMQYVLNFWNWLSVKYDLAAGCFIFCTKEGFEAIGGFSERVYASEEIWLSLGLKSWGKKQNLSFRIITDPPAVTSMRKLEWYSPLQMLLLSLPVLIFPPLVLFQWFCKHWYRRP
jgi:glycosyltransferase involved in cell wall biosynthesis